MERIPPSPLLAHLVLSAVARAFFYSGAHALLVSNWRIDSKAARPDDHIDVRPRRGVAETAPVEGVPSCKAIDGHRDAPGAHAAQGATE
jgi:hypothetical protein